MQKIPSLHSKQSGLTLLEMVVVVGVILILASIAVPSIFRGRRQAQISNLANEFRVDYEMFVTYAQESAVLPPDSQISTPPPGMETYFTDKTRTTWTTDNSDGHLTTPQVRGRWVWQRIDLDQGESRVASMPEYNGFIIFYSPDIDDQMAKDIDARLDDGNINTGALRYAEGQGGYKFLYYGVN